MNKAFIFDMDGVIINSEVIWGKKEHQFLTDIFGKKVYEQIKDHVLGSTTDVVYDIAVKNGATIDKKTFLEKYDVVAQAIYEEAELTQNLEQLLQRLIDLNFRLALVTASRTAWMEQVLSKLSNPNIFDCVLSLAQKKGIRPKPFPDGYTKVMKELSVHPSHTIILEDAPKGVEAAKASGALTICLTEHLPEKHRSEKADIYIKTLSDVIQFVNLITI